MNIRELVGKRVLLTRKSGVTFAYGQQVNEYKVMEVSPSGNWAKLMDLNGRKFWSRLDELGLIEVLQDLKADRPKDI